MTQEHTIAVVEPALDGEMTIKYAKEAVDRGGRATIIVLLGMDTIDGIAAFAEAENLTFPDGREIYMDRLAHNYSEIFNGKEQVTVVPDGPTANRVVFERAGQQGATTVVVPQRLVSQRRWKSAVAKSPVPVMVTPTKAA